jgi:hypothetical protein
VLLHLHHRPGLLHLHHRRRHRRMFRRFPSSRGWYRSSS